MKKEDARKALAAVQTLQTLHNEEAGYDTAYGDDAIALLQAEIDKPEPEPVAWMGYDRGMPYVTAIREMAKREGCITPLYTKEQL